MRKTTLLLVVLLLGLVAGCGVELPTPSPSPTQTVLATSPPPPTEASTSSEATVPDAPESEVGSTLGSASCVAAPFDFPTESRIPSITEDDHVHGPDDASITFIEYADFQ